MKENSHISAGLCLDKVFLLLMNWKSRESEQPDSHSLALAPPSCSMGQVCPFSPQFPHSSWVLLPAWEGRAEPLCTACWWQPLPHHLAQEPTAGTPSPASFW